MYATGIESVGASLDILSMVCESKSENSVGESTRVLESCALSQCRV